jgi:CRP/FNR family transcriptional regulator
MPVNVEALREVPLFARLNSNSLAQVAAVARERHYERGDLIVREGESGGALHCVHSGLVKVFKLSTEGKEQVLFLAMVGHTFNDVPALDGGTNLASAAAMELSSVYTIGHEELRTLIVAQPDVALTMVRMLGSRVRHLVALVEDLSLRPVIARVAKILLDQEIASQEGRQIYRLTQQEMAALAGTAREVVGRALKEVEAAGAIKMCRGRVVVVNPDRLCLFMSSETDSASRR